MLQNSINKKKKSEWCVQSLLSKSKTWTYGTATFWVNTPKWSKGKPNDLYEIWEVWYITTFWNINDEEFNIENLDFPTGAIEVVSITKTWWDWNTESQNFTITKSWFYFVKMWWNQLATSLKIKFPSWFEFLWWTWNGTIWYWNPQAYSSAMVYLYAWTYTFYFYSSRYQSSYWTANLKVVK